MSLVRLDDVVREVGTFVILDHVTAAIAAGDRIGLVGPNGAGKTTLLRIVAGRDEPDRGSVHLRRGLSVGLLAQEAHLDDAFMAAPDLRAAVRHGARHLEEMERELRELERSGQAGDPRYADLQHRFDTLGGYTLDQRVDEALSGLGFDRSEWQGPPTALSGGQQTRATLARLVVADPELLLLDEPTNHLDLAALEWLEERLRRRAGALVVASHDRAFLDATVTRIWELRDRRVTTFRGDYSAYHRQREERDALAAKQADAHADAVGREQELVQRYRSQRKYSKMHEHEARLERLRDETPTAPRRRRKLALPTGALAGGGPARSGELVVRVEDLVVGYLPGRGRELEVDGRGGAGIEDGRSGEWEGAAGLAEPAPREPSLDEPPVREPRIVARIPFLAAQRGERIGIVGPNGAGKTTLLRTIAGDLPPLDGVVAFGHAVQLGYLAQLRGAAIPGATVLDALLDALPVTPGEARSYLARFLFRGDDVEKEVRTLSGGERSRLELALLGILPSNLLLLDEPTNHLDIPAREAIETFLLESPATILVVSHDRRLLETVCDRLWVVDHGLAAPFDGRYRAWRSAVADGWTVEAAADVQRRRLHGGVGAPPGPRPRAGASRASSDSSREAPPVRAGRGAMAAGPAGTMGSSGGNGTRELGRKRRLSKEAYRRQAAVVEAELTRLGLRKSHLELALADPGTQRNFVELRRVTSELADVDTALTAAEEAWLELEERAP
ncbi:MAG TPA: ABC-F family ATP-binding cassette domain-containing protein [Candidatus Dormibacteraeota bacterium]|nr:ABC-F family ATP-binding cassette domain-containing protein [Candidatus Dormibacteraeota bacterium]